MNNNLNKVNFIRCSTARACFYSTTFPQLKNSSPVTRNRHSLNLNSYVSTKTITYTPVTLNAACCKYSTHAKTTHTQTPSSTPAATAEANGDLPLVPDTYPLFVRDKVAGVDPTRNRISLLYFDAADGGGAACVHQELRTGDLLSIAGVEARDVRKFLSTTRRKQIPTITVREKCIILTMDHIKALIMSDRLYLFEPFRDKRVDRFASFLPSLVFQSPKATVQVPFEFRALEAILIEVTENIDMAIKDLQPKMTRLLDDLAASQRPPQLRMLREASDELNALHTRIRSIRHTIADVLGNDEDLVSLYLTDKRAGRQRKQAEHADAEMLFENYMLQLEESEFRASELVQRVSSMETYIMIHFDSQRNLLMRMNLVVSMGAFSASMGAMAAGLFGMNLTSGLEHNPTAFAVIASIISSYSALSFGAMYLIYRKTKYPYALVHESDIHHVTKATSTPSPTSVSNSVFSTAMHSSNPSNSSTSSSSNLNSTNASKRSSNENNTSQTNHYA